MNYTELKKLKHTEVSTLPITKKDILVIKMKDDCPLSMQNYITQYRDDLAKGLCPNFVAAIMICPPGVDLQVLQVEKDYIDVSKLQLKLGKKD